MSGPQIPHEGSMICHTQILKSFREFSNLFKDLSTVTASNLWKSDAVKQATTLPFLMCVDLPVPRSMHRCPPLSWPFPDALYGTCVDLAVPSIRQPGVPEIAEYASMKEAIINEEFKYYTQMQKFHHSTMFVLHKNVAAKRYTGIDKNLLILCPSFSFWMCTPCFPVHTQTGPAGSSRTQSGSEKI